MRVDAVYQCALSALIIAPSPIQIASEPTAAAPRIIFWAGVTEGGAGIADGAASAPVDVRAWG